MSIYYFHIRDELGVVEDQDGVELADIAALVAEVMRTATELSREAAVHHSMQFEITDADGQTVLVAPVQFSVASWELMTEIIIAQRTMH